MQATYAAVYRHVPQIVFKFLIPYPYAKGRHSKTLQKHVFFSWQCNFIKSKIEVGGLRLFLSKTLIEKTLLMRK